MQEPRKNLLKLGLSESEVTVYLAMVAGARLARDLVKVTRLKRPTVYYALGCLAKRGLISKTGIEGEQGFSLEPVQKLAVIAKEKSLESAQLESKINELIPSLEVDLAPANQKPSVSFYEGNDAVKNAIMDSLYSRSKELYSIVPSENFFWQTGRDFVELFVEERKKRGIVTKNLWEKEVESDIIKKHYQGNSKVRILPDIMLGRFKTTVFIYDDKTLYISSKPNSYCVLITSQEQADTMRAWFDGLWETCLPHKK